jgi:hypothetical protein
VALVRGSARTHPGRHHVRAGYPHRPAGLKRAAAAGWLLLAAGIVPVAVSSLGSLLGFTSLAVASSAPVITGVLYLLSARVARRPAAPARADAVPGERPKAA